MNRRQDGTEALIKAFKKRKILTLAQIREITPWSPMTLWRHLKPIGYYTSFNLNARYYTLAGIPRFDDRGLWFCRQVGFSVHGTLSRTLAALVRDSPMGMTPGELSAILMVRVQNQLLQLYANDELGRATWGRGQLYLSVDQEVRAEQLGRREAHQQSAVRTEGVDAPPTQEETIEILAELVRRPRSSARGVANLLGARGWNVTRPKVLAVIEKYGLQKKGR